MALPLVGVIMGSQSDWPTMQHAAEVLARLDVPHEVCIVSAHRTPDRLQAYAKAARGRGLRAIIAGAGGAAHLPGMCAAWTPLPVLGVLLLFEALSLAMLLRDISTNRSELLVALLVGLLCAGLPYGYLVGLVVGTAVHYAMQRGWVGLGK